MRIVEQHISEREASFERHPFFVALRPEPSLERALAFAPTLAFWVLGFQDVLRLNQERTADPELRALMARHRADEAHDQWFLEDLARIGGMGRSALAWLFGPACLSTRDATYAVASEALRISDDRLRLVLVMTLESGSRVFFGRVSAHVEASGHTSGLRFFSRTHLDAEREHDLFEDHNQHRLRAIELAPEVRAEAIALVDRVFASVVSIADQLLRVTRDQTLPPPR